MSIKPYKDRNERKKQQIALMFDSISRRYDLLNHLLSMGIDIWWRKKAVRQLKPFSPRLILDLATGTGDLAIEALSLGPEKVIGIDISKSMLEIGRQKIKKNGLEDKIDFIQQDSENLSFPDNIFDAVIVAFGVRNFENLHKGLSEMNRVLKKGGHTVILEFSKPTLFPFKQIFNLYFHQILPLIGKNISKDNFAYRYLPESVKLFPEKKEFTQMLDEIGFINTKYIPLTFGISTIYIGEK